MSVKNYKNFSNKIKYILKKYHNTVITTIYVYVLQTMGYGFIWYMYIYVSLSLSLSLSLSYIYNIHTYPKGITPIHPYTKTNIDSGNYCIMVIFNNV